MFFKKKVVGKIKTQFYVPYVPFLSCRFQDSVGRYCRAGQATDDNIAHGHCMLDN